MTDKATLVAKTIVCNKERTVIDLDTLWRSAAAWEMIFEVWRNGKGTMSANMKTKPNHVPGPQPAQPVPSGHLSGSSTGKRKATQVAKSEHLTSGHKKAEANKHDQSKSGRRGGGRCI